MNYYNEHEPSAAAWLRELIAAGVIPPGEVDVRSIVEVKPHELKPYAQCHFFAGIGGWSYALQLAGWPVERPVWTGSCPCQPFSAAGQGMGEADPRHLWPVFRNLIGECRPPVVFGEQVASALGREWLAGIRTDLEGLGYEVGAADLCAAGVGAPQIRQRLYWVADANGVRRNQQRRTSGPSVQGQRAERTKTQAEPGHDGKLSGRLEGLGPNSVRMGDANSEGPQGRHERIIECSHQWPAGTPNLVVLCTDGKARRFEPGAFPVAHGLPDRVGRLRGYGNAIVPQLAAEFIQAWCDVAFR